MGLRFSLKNANAVGHLTQGNAFTFFNQTLSSDQIFIPNLDFIEKLISYRSLITTREFQYSIDQEIERLRDRWESFRDEMYHLRDRTILNREKYSVPSQPLGFQNTFVLNFLQDVSKILSRCKVKSLLLPGFNGSETNYKLMQESFLRDLVNIHPGDSALILQIEDQLEKGQTSLLNVFPRFNSALTKIEQWPGVLLWNNEDSLFVPIETLDEVLEIFYILRYEGENYFSQLRTRFERKKKNKYAYLFHLSDLHFGNKVANSRKLRVVKILESKLAELDDSVAAIPLITGDMMDTPSNENKLAFSDFIEHLSAKGFEHPIHILGNHDVDSSGFIKMLTNQKSVISSLSSGPRIVVIDELNLAFVKFDSNTGGQLAQGLIGDPQFLDIGNEIDTISKRKKDLTYIALVHHHPKVVENPDWYEEDWYEALLGNIGYEKSMKLIDADKFLQWIEARGIKYVLHGHKHIPKVHSHNDITIIAAGSASGAVRHKEEGKTYLSYNLIKYDLDQRKPVSCAIIAEQILGAGTKNVLLKTF